MIKTSAYITPTEIFYNEIRLYNALPLDARKSVVKIKNFQAGILLITFLLLISVLFLFILLFYIFVNIVVFLIILLSLTNTSQDYMLNVIIHSE